MHPYYQDNEIAIYLGDCLEIIPKCPNVDLVLTDPPYGIHFRSHSWDKSIPNWLELAKAKADNIMFTTAPTTQWDYPRPDWVVLWDRPASQSRNIFGGFNHWTPILLYGSFKVPVDRFYLNARSAAYPKCFEHCTPKPEKLMTWLIGLSPQSRLILDPFMGSGTTLRAAKDLGRKAIGIEIEEKYCEIAARRMTQEVFPL